MPGSGGCLAHRPTQDPTNDRGMINFELVLPDGTTSCLRMQSSGSITRKLASSTFSRRRPATCNQRQSTKRRSCPRSTLSTGILRGGERSKSTPMTPRGSSTRSRDHSTVSMPFSSSGRRQRRSNFSGTCRTTTGRSKQRSLVVKPWIIRPTEKSSPTRGGISKGAIGCDLGRGRLAPVATDSFRLRARY